LRRAITAAGIGSSAHMIEIAMPIAAFGGPATLH
jgi:hypothetical protein